MIEQFKEFYQSHRSLCLFIPVCIVLGLVSFLVSPSHNQIDRKKPYVYTKETFLYQNQIDSYLPVVNLKGNDAKTLNQELEKLYQDKENTLLTYKYDISGDYLSLIYCVIDMSHDLPFYEMKTKVFSIPSKRALKTEEILKLYKTTEEEIHEMIEENMHLYYEELVQNGYIEANECSYQCFLKDRKFDANKDLQLAIEEGNLYAYQGFVVDGIYGEGDFFTKEHFQFLIKRMDF